MIEFLSGLIIGALAFGFPLLIQISETKHYKKMYEFQKGNADKWFLRLAKHLLNQK